MVICGYRCCKGQRIEYIGEVTANAQQYYLLIKEGEKSKPTKTICDGYETVNITGNPGWE